MPILTQLEVFADFIRQQSEQMPTPDISTQSSDLGSLPFPTDIPNGPGWLIQFSITDLGRLQRNPTTSYLGYWNYYADLSGALNEASRYISIDSVIMWAAGGRNDGSVLVQRFRHHAPRTTSPLDWGTFVASVQEHGFYLVMNDRYTPAVRANPTETARAIPGQLTHGLVASLEAAQNWRVAVGAPETTTPWVFFNADICSHLDTYLQTSSAETDTDTETRTGWPQYMPSNDTVKVADTHPILPSNAGARVCSRCGETGHNIRTCENHFQLWDKMGIEVEGRFLNLSAKRELAVTLTGEEGTSDGSLRHSGNGDCWEFRTRPGKLASAMTQLHALYPDETGPDCGMHIHVSFSTADIALLYNTDFFTYFRDEWKVWGEANSVHRSGEFWKRLSGENNYCRQNISASGRVESNGGMGDRYHQLNFSAWDAHKTVECRLLPMFKSEALALSACKKLISIYETWLSMDHSSRLPEVHVDLPAPILGTELISSEVEIPEIKFDVETEIAVYDIPPPAPGLIRVVIPTGEIQATELGAQHRATGVRDFVNSYAHAA